MSNLDKYKALGQQAAAEGKNMTEAQTGGGGGDYEPPKAGPCTLRLVGYFEIGKHKSSFQGQDKITDKVQMVFEVIGKNYPPTILPNGDKVPVRITLEENFSLNEKARFFKLFTVMNYKGTAKHMVELLNEPFKSRIIHRTYKRRDGKEGVAVELFDKDTGSFTIAPPRYEEVQDGEPTGNWLTMNVAPAITPIKAFLWDYSDLDDWNAIKIEGSYPERKDKEGNVTAPAKSKNVIQEAIKSAINFKGSNIFNLLTGQGVMDLGEAEQYTPAQDEVAHEPVSKTKELVGADADDALNGIV